MLCCSETCTFLLILPSSWLSCLQSLALLSFWVIHTSLGWRDRAAYLELPMQLSFLGVLAFKCTEMHPRSWAP